MYGVGTENLAAERFFVHVGQHQDFSGISVLGDGGDQAVLVEFYVF
jgi:hypothetical protein